MNKKYQFTAFRGDGKSLNRAIESFLFFLSLAQPTPENIRGVSPLVTILEQEERLNNERKQNRELHHPSER